MCPDPPPAGFVEVAAFERLQRDTHARTSRRLFADIVCGVEFTPDGRLLASAGVAKQVPYRQAHFVVACGVSGHVILQMVKQKSSVCRAGHVIGYLYFGIGAIALILRHSESCVTPGIGARVHSRRSGRACGCV